jgi:SAM-dependent methyltransferase
MLRDLISSQLSIVLWGNRKQFGLIQDNEDLDWKIWQEKAYSDFYQNTQQRGIGDRVNRMAYPVIGRIDFDGKRVLEIGPGIIRHLEYIKNTPTKYTILDISEDLLRMSGKQLGAAGVHCETFLLARESGSELPFRDESFDIVISFNSLEHLHPVENYLVEIKRILKRGGQVVGGIPCEGGLAWGLGRFLTTRRYVHKNYGINYDKIICWEHPNFADFIIEQLDAQFQRKYLRLHPFPFLPIDFNLVASFVYTKHFCLNK